MSLRDVVLGALAVIFFGAVSIEANDRKEADSTDVEASISKVTYKVLHVNPVVRGTVEAAYSGDVRCEVKSGPRGAPKIKWVVANGAKVEQGDLLVELEDSYWRERADSQLLARNKAVGELADAEELYTAEKLQTDLAVTAVQSEIKSARLERKQLDDDADARRRALESRLPATIEALSADNIKAALKALEKSVSERRKTLDAKVARAEAWLVEEQREAADRISEAETSLVIARANWKTEGAEYADCLEQIQNCKVYAPRAGVVIYFAPEQTTRGFGSNQSIIAPGENVCYGQKLMSIPDPSGLLVNLRVPEQLIRPVKKGQPATVRIDGLPNKVYKAHVRSVSNHAVPLDFMSPDVKVYQTYVEIDDAADCRLNYRRNMGADVAIITEPAEVLAAPLQAIVPPKEKGEKSRCLLNTRGGPQEREVTLGVSSGRWVEIKSGLKMGEEVYLNPQKVCASKREPPAKPND